MQKENDYLVKNPKLVLEYLTVIFNKKCIISAHFGENDAAFLTAIVELDPKNNRLQIDCAPSELLNKQLLNSAKAQFRTEIDGIKVSFNCKDIKKSKTGDGMAFEMPIPDAIFWLQRREFYRVRIPLSHTGSYCKLTYRTGDEPTLTRTATLKLADLSIGGFALLNTDAEFAGLFATDTSYTEECCLYLHEGPHANIEFTIKDISEIKVSATTTQQRIGCLFTKVTPAFETVIQRYMRDIERHVNKIS